MKKTLIILALMLMSAISTIATEKPKVILFSMKGCSACKHFAPVFEKMSSKYAAKFNFVKENANSKMADDLGINYVPMVFIMDAEKNTKTAIDSDCLAQEGCFEQKLMKY